jgi:hypothetical protein
MEMKREGGGKIALRNCFVPLPEMGASRASSQSDAFIKHGRPAFLGNVLCCHFCLMVLENRCESVQANGKASRNELVLE